MSGRPCMCEPSERLCRPIGTNVTEPQYLLIKEFADDNGLTVTGLLRESLKVYLRDRGVRL